MKKSAAFLFFILLMCCSALAQSKFRDFDKVREIKLLEATRADVVRILSDFKSDADEDEANKAVASEPIYSETFSNESADIDVSYSIINCSDDLGSWDKWNVATGKVKSIDIYLNKPIKFKKFKFDTSDFLKEQRYFDDKDLYVYHNKNLGIALDVNEGAIETIHLFPSNSYYSLLCENESAEKTKEFYSTESFFGNTNLEDRLKSVAFGYANVIDLTLSTNEISIGCEKSAEKKNCSDDKTKVSVVTRAVDPENDVLSYNYNVSGGEIVGSGAEVVWNLSGVPAGTYTITAGVDDGCGICGRTVTQTIVIKQKPADVKEIPLPDTEIQSSGREKQPLDREKSPSDTK